MGLVQRSVFTKASIERAIYTTRIGLKAILDCNLLSMDIENAFNIISLYKMNKNDEQDEQESRLASYYHVG
jgi:hypothetical protein